MEFLSAGDGLRHEAMETRFEFQASRREYVVHVNWPLGARAATYGLDGVEWALRENGVGSR